MFLECVCARVCGNMLCNLLSAEKKGEGQTKGGEEEKNVMIEEKEKKNFPLCPVSLYEVVYENIRLSEAYLYQRSLPSSFAYQHNVGLSCSLFASHKKIYQRILFINIMYVCNISL